MKSIFYFLVFILIGSCQSKPDQDDLAYLNGYWEIDQVVFPDGTKKVYQVNDWIDFFQLKANKGWRQKVQPQMDGKFIPNELKETIQLIDSNACYYLRTKATYTSWSEKVISVSKDAFVVENDAKIVYHYKRFVPYTKRN